MDYEAELLRAKALAQSDPEKALSICNNVLDADFNGKHGQMALFMVAYLMLEAEHYGLAYQLYERCSQLNSNVSEVYSNMGMCLEEYNPHKARKMFQKAAKLKPNNAHAYANEALICLQTGSPAECIRLCDKALAIEPTLRAAIHNKGLALIMLRQWRDGWKLYHDTLGVKHRERRDYGLPEWDGTPDKTVIVYGEQGVGDELMFSSCLPDLMQTNEVILDCDSRLVELFQRSFNIHCYGTRFKKETPILDNHQADYQCAIGQLPYFYRNDEVDFPGTPYLTPSADHALMWRALFDTFKGRKIGVAWRGGLPNTGQKKRSLRLQDFHDLFNDQDTFISLEYLPVDQKEIEHYNLKTYPRVTGKGQSIDELAALVSQLDLVVTCCTTVVYVAGALGIPCFVLVPDKPGYRYPYQGNFPWYHSVKLIRQSGSWRNTVKRMLNDPDFHRLGTEGNSSLSCAGSLDSNAIQSACLHHPYQQAVSS